MKYLKTKLFTPFLFYTLSLISGMLMGATVAPVGAWFLAWVALAPLWVLVVKNIPEKKKIFLAFTWAIAFHGTALCWITGIHPMNWLGVPWWPSLAITLFCWAFISLWGGILVSTWAFLMVKLDRQNPGLRVLIGTVLWCSLESLWSMGPLWWSSLSYTQSPHNLIILHLGQLSGPTTITAVIVACNGLIAELWMNRKEIKFLWVATVILISSHLIGLVLYTIPLTQLPADALKIGIIQGNISNEIKLRPEGLGRAITGYTDGYIKLANQGVAGVLTPEGALPVFQRNLKNTPLLTAVREKGVVVWIGAFGEKGNSYTNSLFNITGNGEITSRYDKSKLVPLGEYIPFEGILGGLIQRLSPLNEHQIPGSANQVFNTPFGKAIVGICYESAFSEIFRYQAAKGGEFILSLSNDAHYTSAMLTQHHAQDIMRAVETDRWAVRATNTGYSAFVDPHGRTLWISGHNTYETHAETIYRRQTQTLYVRWGDWLMPLLFGLGVLGWLSESGYPGLKD
ncbi:apolipoprotein N-acyltransferase [Cronbergia sp. UHCC 0137]|uniref:apolipoprotein N-acyltransferase n=1 Tax=Cronbergia sp. UHCC 0137 TaxID=3110239 RepID=UPI002B210C55|nr:apolipoprotein N-acyltransferase [Cronbergia sp. UHCC 0137]MEA5617042.1 apolipoprotein N-acyltransferase [Cronbergia sp. UHCC 0137]